MPITIRFDRAKPMASVEFMIQGALPHYEVAKAQAEDRTEVQPLLTAPGFKRLVEDVRSAFERRLTDTKFELVQISGIICHDLNVYRPGILLIVQEPGREGTIPEKGRERVTATAEAVRERLGMS
ncbi:MAG TPA: hypothetical protein VFW94_22630 [Candidatus Acidoferrales bacterium]|nr:hypothetical protein [Candidatus Acidoferrales bacterium]